jgi:hypothetical protein
MTKDIETQTFAIGMVALAMYTAGAFGAVSVASTFNQHVKVISAHRAGGSVEAEIELKRPPENQHAFKLSLVTQHGPPYRWQDFEWDELRRLNPDLESGPSPGATLKLKLPVDASKLGTDALRIDVVWGDARTVRVDVD